MLLSHFLDECSDLEEGVHYGASKYQEFKTDTFEDCREICQKLPSCVGWSFHMEKLKCELKASMWGPENDENWISGLKFCDGKRKS